VDQHVSASITGLTIQFIATLLVTILLTVLTRSVRRTFLDCWVLSGASLSLALSSLFLSFITPTHGFYLLPIYFFGEYLWAYLLLAGCRNLIHGTKPRRSALGLAPAGIIVAAVLPQLQVSFNVMFAIHSAVLAGFFAVAAASLVRSRDQRRHGVGRWVMVTALVLMAMVFAHYVPLCAYAGWTGQDGDFPHLKHSSLYDMLLEILLAFGMVMVAMDSVRRELEQMNFDLGAASLRLQAMAQEDPLTGAYNRNAFNSFVGKQCSSRQGTPDSDDAVSCERSGCLGCSALAGPFDGCVALIDLNDLKRINDKFGHPSGDAAIQAVAKAIRSVIRADDLLFRWGGDEFLILWPKVDEQHARRRLEALNPKLREVFLPGFSAPVPIGVAYGVAPIEDLSNLEQAIHEADSEMYAHKYGCKSGPGSEMELAI
jgi:diguanylate cyclase